MGADVKHAIAVVVSAGLLAGCSIFVPFEQEFSCTADRQYGKCTNVEGAYSEALGGDLGNVALVGEDDVAKGQKKKRDAKHGAPNPPPPPAIGGFTKYKDAEYAELAKIIESPVTPVVRPPEVLRTLVVAYATGEKTLYMPRYVYYFASEAGFVMGDYLSAEQPLTPPTLYPQGIGAE